MSKAKEVDFLSAVADEFESDEDLIVGRDDGPKEWLDTGSYALNRIISGDYLKGYPYGKLIEIFGDPSAGKSYLINMAMGMHQKKFGKKAATVIDDAEDAFMESFAEEAGVDISRIIRRHSDTVEDHFKGMFADPRPPKKFETEEEKEARKAKKPPLLPFILGTDPDAKILLALDSIAILSTKHEQGVGLDKSDMSRAKQIRAGIRMNWGFISKNDVLYLITNHVIADINSSSYAPMKTTPGGKAVPFMSTVRIELTIREKIKRGEEIIGVMTEAFIKKNKVAPPFKKAKIKIDFEGKGIDRMSGVVDLLIHDGILLKKGKERVKNTAKDMLWIDEKRKIEASEFTEEVFLQLLADTKAALVEKEIAAQQTEDKKESKK